jgi:SAM-dependent methyltransferase
MKINKSRPDPKYAWHFDKVSPYYYGDKITFYQLGHASVSEMLKFLKRNYNYELKQTDSVLDIGCGVGRLAQFVAPHVSNITCIDVSEGMVEASKNLLKNFNNVYVEKVDGSGVLKFEDKKFDMIFSHGTLGFVSDEALTKYVQESFRTLKEGGILAFQIPNYNAPFALLWGCDANIAKERLRLLFRGELPHPTEKSRLGVPKNKKEINSLMTRSGFEDIYIERPSLKRIYYLTSGVKGN